MTDAFITFLVLAIASVILWRASLSPLDAIDRSTAEAESLQVSSLVPALMRITLDETSILDSAGAAQFYHGESVARLLAVMHARVHPTGCEPSPCQPSGGHGACKPEVSGDACEVATAASDILRTSSSLSAGRWILRVEVADEDRHLCLRLVDESDPEGGALATRSRCELPKTRVISQETFVPRLGSASSALTVHVGAFKAVGR